jgi:uncharacterized protein (DUF983 family)
MVGLPCPGCGGRSTEQTPACPWCGRPLHGNRRGRPGPGLVAVLIVLALAIAGLVWFGAQMLAH